MADPIVMTADAIPAMLDDPAFQALPFERKQKLAEDAIAEAGRQLSGSWDTQQFVDWGKFTEKVRSKLGEQDTLLNQAGREVRDLGEGAVDMATGLAKDAGTVAISAADAINPGGHGFGVPALKTMGSGFVAGLKGLKASGEAFLAGGGEAETKLKTDLDSLKKDIDEGNLPLDDPQKFTGWLQEHDAKLSDARSKFFADAESQLERGFTIPEPTDLQKTTAAQTGLTNPENQKLIAAYMVNRSPETWKALEQSLFKTPEMQAADAEKAAALKSPGAIEFERAFGALGEGASEHLLSASHPLMIAGLAIPAFRGAAAAEAAAAETGIGATARQVATKAAKGAPEMGAFGAAQQIERNPQSTAVEIGTAAAQMAGAGALLIGATGLGGALIKRGVNGQGTTIESGELPLPPPVAEPSPVPEPSPEFKTAAGLAANFGGPDAARHVAEAQALADSMSNLAKNEAAPAGNDVPTRAAPAPVVSPSATGTTPKEAGGVTGDTRSLSEPLPKRPDEAVRGKLKNKLMLGQDLSPEEQAIAGAEIEWVSAAQKLAPDSPHLKDDEVFKIWKSARNNLSSEIGIVENSEKGRKQVSELHSALVERGDKDGAEKVIKAAEGTRALSEDPKSIFEESQNSDDPLTLTEATQQAQNNKKTNKAVRDLLNEMRNRQGATETAPPVKAAEPISPEIPAPAGNDVPTRAAPAPVVSDAPTQTETRKEGAPETGDTQSLSEPLPNISAGTQPPVKAAEPISPEIPAPAQQTPTEEPSNAAQTRIVTEDNQPEHQNGNDARQAAEASGSNRDVQSGQVAPEVTPAPEAVTSGEPPPAAPATAGGPPPTSNKEAVVNAERALRALGPIPKEDVIKNVDTLERGAKAVAADPALPSKIVERLRTAGPEERTISLDDSGALIIERVKLNNERAKQMEVLADAAATPEEKAVAKTEFDSVESKLNALDQAAQDARSAWGRFGQFWQRLVKNDFTLDALTRKARASKGRALTPEEAAVVAKHAEEHAAETKKAEEASAALAEIDALKHQNTELQRLLDEAGKKRTSKPVVEKEPRDYTPKKPFGERVIKYADERTAELAKEIRNLVSGRANIGLDPTLLVRVVEYGALKLTKGAVKFSRWAAEMKAELGGWVEEHLKDLWTQTKAKVETFAANAGRDIAGERTATVAKMKERVAEGDSPSDLHRYARAIAKQHIDEGITELDPLNKAVHDTLKEVFPTITEQEARDAWSGYGQWKPLDKDPNKVILRERSTEAQKLSTYERLKAGLAGLRTGAERQAPTEKARAMDKANKRLQKELGIQATDPATQLKSTLDGIKSRLKNEIADMDYAIATGKRMVKDKSGVSLDKEALDLKAQREAKKILYDAVFPKEKISDAEAMRRATVLAEHNLDQWNTKLENAKKGVFEKRAEPTPTVPGERLAEIQDQVKAAKAEVEHLKDLDSAFQEQQAQERLQKTADSLEQKLRDGEAAFSKANPTLGPDSAAVTALKARNTELRKLIAAARSTPDARITANLERAIQKISADLASGETAPKTKTASRPDTEQNARLRDELQSLKDFKADIKRASIPRKSDAEIRLQGMKAAALRRIADLARRRREGDFEPKEKKPPPVAVTPEEKELQRKLDKALVAKAKIERGFQEDRMKDRLEKRTKFERFTNFMAGLARANVLGHLSVLEHLGGAAVENIVTRPVGSAIAQLLRFTKATEAIRKRAVYEGGWGGEMANARGIINSYSELLRKLTTGKSEMDWLHEDAKAYPKGVMEWVGNIHGAIKEPIRQGIYARAMELGMKAAEERGLDPAHNEVLLKAIGADAYRMANEDIFIGDNFLTRDIHQNTTARLRSEKVDSRLAKFTADVLDVMFPVVNVPINIMIRKLRFMAGLPEFATRLAIAKSEGKLANGAEKLTQHEAEQITRAFKYGVTGAALAAYAWTHANQFGGIYAAGQNAPRDKKSGLKPGEIALPDGLYFDHISHQVAHGPWGAYLNMVADARRLYDKSGGDMSESAAFALMAPVKDLPAFSTIGRITSPYYSAAQKAGEIVKNIVVFGALQDAAEMMDDKKRAPKSFMDEIKSGIPFLREQVPVAKRQ